MDIQLILLAAAPALVGALLPGRWAYAWFGWCALILGLLAIDYGISAPAERSGILRADLLMAWAIAGAMAMAGRRLLDVWRGPGTSPSNPDLRILLRWEIPVGSLIAIASFRGLSNLFAGFSPAWLAHLAVIVAIGIGAAFLVRHVSVAKEMPGRTAFLSLIILFVAMVLVGSGMNRAMQVSRRASIFADGAPYCILTYDRSGRPRAATSTFDLSPLVMRLDGRYPINRVPWLLVRDRYGTAGYTYVYATRRFALMPLKGPLPCTPS